MGGGRFVVGPMTPAGSNWPRNLAAWGHAAYSGYNPPSCALHFVLFAFFVANSAVRRVGSWFVVGPMTPSGGLLIESARKPRRVGSRGLQGGIFALVGRGCIPGASLTPNRILPRPSPIFMLFVYFAVKTSAAPSGFPAPAFFSLFAVFSGRFPSDFTAPSF